MLATAVGCEVLWAVMLKVSPGFTVLWANVVTALAYLLSLVFLERACRHFDLGLAYAVWTGSGTTLVALIGMLVFREQMGPGRAFGLLLVVTGVAVLLGLERRP
jgi:small multidrug resistance pump